MHILIVGASGLVGSAAVRRLSTEGHEVIGAARHLPDGGLLKAKWIKIDVARADQNSWLPHLAGVDAVLNCAGTLQDSPTDSTSGVYMEGVSALISACDRADVRKFVHLSAIGVDRETPTRFSQTKLAGDSALMRSNLDWVILRPSVIVGPSAYGGSALIRGLASLPILPVMPDTAPIQAVHLNDVLDAISFFLKPNAPAKRVVELVGPEQYSFEGLIALFRQWMGWPRARLIACPRPIAALAYRAGDAVSLLGWSSPVRTTGAREMVRGAVGDASAFKSILGQEPRNLRVELERVPAGVQERWFARLYLLKPLVFGILVWFWITTGIVSLGPGWQRGVELVVEGGASEAIAKLAVISGGLADIVIGLLIAYRKTARLGLYAAFAISIAYAIIGTLLVPWMWFDPLGPMLKIAPIMVFNLVALAILPDR